MRPSSVIGLSALAVALLALLAQLSTPATPICKKLADNRAIVEKYGLTDLALFTEARYTRHPSQADLHSAFQDHPGALEHFPTGSLLAPRPSSINSHESLAGKTTSPD
jgi:hypothetical protein